MAQALDRAQELPSGASAADRAAVWAELAAAAAAEPGAAVKLCVTLASPCRQQCMQCAEHSFVCTEMDSKLRLSRWHLGICVPPLLLAAAAATAPPDCPARPAPHCASPSPPPLAAPGFAADNAAELAQLVVKSLPDYADADSQRAVQRLVDVAVQQDAFLKALAGGIVKNEKAKLRPHVGAAAACCCRLEPVQEKQPAS